LIQARKDNQYDLRDTELLERAWVRALKVFDSYLEQAYKPPANHTNVEKANGNLQSRQTFRLSITTSGPTVQRVIDSLKTWMPHMPSTAKVTLNMNKAQYNESVWKNISIPVRTFSTSLPGDEENWYFLAQQVMVSGLRDWADIASNGDFEEDWLLQLDDDVALTPAIFKTLSKHDPDEPFIFARHYSSWYAGGHGLFVSRGALKLIDASCMNGPSCSPENKYSDMTIAAVLMWGGQLAITDWPQLETLAPHKCIDTCPYDLVRMPNFTQSSTWKLPGFSVAHKHGCPAP
jgi:hypothetical protein